MRPDLFAALREAFRDVGHRQVEIAFSRDEILTLIGALLFSLNWPNISPGIWKTHDPLLARLRAALEADNAAIVNSVFSAL